MSEMTLGPVHGLDRKALLDVGVRLGLDVLDRAGLTQPEVVVFPTRHRLNEFGWYRRGKIHINMMKCRLPVKTPGYSWSFPGYKADLTPVGVYTHELGHHVDKLFGHPRLTGWSKEPRVTSYEPNRGEAFAEAFKLFATNPDLLRVGRPVRWEFLLEHGLVSPDELVPWGDVLRRRGAHDKLLKAAENWAKAN